jgi:hypothetical protein
MTLQWKLKEAATLLRAGHKFPTEHRTAIFRQVNKHLPNYHHDTLEFPDGETVPLTSLNEGQHATVLQLPATPRTEKEVEEQRRAEYV